MSDRRCQCGSGLSAVGGLSANIDLHDLIERDAVRAPVVGLREAGGGMGPGAHIRGQFVFADPKSKLHTAVRQKANDPANAATRALWHAVVQQLGN